MNWLVTQLDFPFSIKCNDKNDSGKLDNTDFICHFIDEVKDLIMESLPNKKVIDLEDLEALIYSKLKLLPNEVSSSIEEEYLSAKSEILSISNSTPKREKLSLLFILIDATLEEILNRVNELESEKEK